MIIKTKDQLTNEQKINEIKSWICEKINKIDKTLARLIRKKREWAQIDKISNEREITTDTIEIQMIISDCYKQLYVNKMDNLKERDNFLERYNFSRKK